MILIALGSNVTGPWGTPSQTLLRAIEELPRHGVTVLKQSQLIETAPMGPQDQPNYVNAVIAVKTDLSAHDLLRTLHAIEALAGRLRKERWGPRTLDLDIVDYQGLVLNSSGTGSEQLTLPHPGIAARSFVLEPIQQIAPDWTHPLSGETAAFMLRKLYGLSQP
jgi:2-amino-4-hydroxy-6-hydroxymethyldihydropteridine diphosphokinase